LTKNACPEFGLLEVVMKGSEWAAWRKRLGYDVKKLMLELEVGSRQTINNWEKADKVSRVLELALYAVENYPNCRQVFGEGISKTAGRQYFTERGEGS
jgi:DNA-binding XRE family transcriptional regulator